MEEILIAGGKGRLGVSGAGFLHLFWTPGSQVGLDDAMKSIEKMQGLGAGRALPLLVEISDVTVSAAARGAFERAKAVSAVAMAGSTVVDKVVAAALGRHGFSLTPTSPRARWQLNGWIVSPRHRAAGCARHSLAAP